ncbi:MAG: histidine phosphatase family protein [Clostridia bacterium]|jgi:broad specificity phosphatase PhoE|nr:histidine phosphatase family protein [Clostridia bacterium]
MKIYLIRHGQTTGDVEGRFGGDYDDELTRLGIDQANELVSKLQDKEIKALYHSPKIRAVQTVNIIRKGIKAEAIEIENLRERNGYGVLTGLTVEEAKLKYPEELIKFKELGYKYHILESEDNSDFVKRVSEVMEFVENVNENIAIVTHGGVIRTFCRLLDLGEISKLSDCAIIEFEKNEEDLKVKSLDGVKFE